jgi:hypothetical protein
MNGAGDWGQAILSLPLNCLTGAGVKVQGVGVQGLVLVQGLVFTTVDVEDVGIRRRRCKI